MMSTPSSSQSKQDSDIQYLYLQPPSYTNKQFFHPLAFILTFRYLQWQPLHNNNSHQSTSQTTNSQLINGWQKVCTKPHVISQHLTCTIYYWSLLFFFGFCFYWYILILILILILYLPITATSWQRRLSLVPKLAIVEGSDCTNTDRVYF